MYRLCAKTFLCYCGCLVGTGAGQMMTFSSHTFSSVSTFTSDEDGTVHERVQETRGSSFGDGFQEHQTHSKMACQDGHCIGTMGKRTVPLLARPRLMMPNIMLLGGPGKVLDAEMEINKPAPVPEVTTESAQRAPVPILSIMNALAAAEEPQHEELQLDPQVELVISDNQAAQSASPIVSDAISKTPLMQSASATVLDAHPQPEVHQSTAAMTSDPAPKHVAKGGVDEEDLIRDV